MTQAGTRLFEFVALLSLNFLASGLIRAILSLLSSFNRGFPLFGCEPFQDLDEACIVNLRLQFSGLRQHYQLVFHSFGKFGSGNSQTCHPLPCLGREYLPQECLTLLVMLLIYLRLYFILGLILLQGLELPASYFLKLLVIVH
jgi:hypothetical protein